MHWWEDKNLQRLIDEWMAGPGDRLRDLHEMLMDHQAEEADSEATQAACSAIESATLDLRTRLNLRRIEGWRQEWGGGWDASWRMLLGPFRSMLPPERVAELRAEAQRTFDREFFESWGV